MSDYIKYMYREYLEGRTRIKKVNEDQPLFPNTGAGLLIQKNKLTDDWTALNVSDGHYEEESFNHEALAAAFLQGANMGQLRMLNEILDRARLNGPYCLENVADALLSFAPACKAESLMGNPMLHFIELSPIDVQALEDRSTEIKIRDAYFNYCNGKTDIVDMDKNSAYNLLDRYGEGLLGPDDEGLFLIDEEPGMFTAIDNTTGDCWTENFPSRDLAVAYLSGFEFNFLEDYTKRHPVKSVVSQDACKDDGRTAINLSQKTASSREASDRLSEEIGAKPCTREEGTVGDS